MGNKLKSVFSTKMFELGGNIRFVDAESSRKFAKALDMLYEEGRPIEIEGVESISGSIKDGSFTYPPFIQKHVNKAVISIHKEPMPVEIETTSGKRTVTLNQYQTNREVVIETEESAVIYLRVSAHKDNTTFGFTYRIQLEKATRIKDVSESICDTIGILEKFFGPTDARYIKEGKTAYISMIKSLQLTKFYSDKLCVLEKKLNTTFDPEKLGNIDKIISDVCELYLLLVEKEPVRLNAKLTTTTATSITIVDDTLEHQLEAPISLTFCGEVIYKICGQEIRIHTANLLTNAIIKKVDIDDAGVTNILYGDTDSKPMYISYRGFTRKSDATKELKRIMNHKEKYERAKTVEQHIVEGELFW